MAAEVLVNFSEPIRSKSGDLYYGRVLGRLADDGLWEGWVEFVLAGSDEVVKTRRETEQPTHADLRYWALGLTMTFLEGALDRALHPAATRMVTEKRIIVDSAPRRDAPRVPVASRRIVLDPFQTYAQG